MLADALLSEKYVMHQRIQTSNYGVHVVNPSDFWGLNDLPQRTTMPGKLF